MSVISGLLDFIFRSGGSPSTFPELKKRAMNAVDPVKSSSLPELVRMMEDAVNNAAASVNQTLSAKLVESCGPRILKDAMASSGLRKELSPIIDRIYEILTTEEMNWTYFSRRGPYSDFEYWSPNGIVQIVATVEFCMGASTCLDIVIATELHGTKVTYVVPMDDRKEKGKRWEVPNGLGVLKQVNRTGMIS